MSRTCRRRARGCGRATHQVYRAALSRHASASTRRPLQLLMLETGNGVAPTVMAAAQSGCHKPRRAPNSASNTSPEAPRAPAVVVDHDERLHHHAVLLEVGFQLGCRHSKRGRGVAGAAAVRGHGHTVSPPASTRTIVSLRCKAANKNLLAPGWLAAFTVRDRRLGVNLRAREVEGDV
jgi:hypothetical protein